MPTQTNILDDLRAYADRLPQPYLIIGPQATYQYHHWLQPISKMVDVSLSAPVQDEWQAMLPTDWLFLNTPPTMLQLRQAKRVLVCHVSQLGHQYKRRQIQHGLNIISPEDACIELLTTAKTEVGWQEVMALLIKQHASLDWAYLWSCAARHQVSHYLAQIVEQINTELGYCFIELPRMKTGLEQPTLPLSSMMVREITRPLQLS